MSINKKLSALLVMLLLGIVVNAQSQRNFIRTDVMLDSAGSATMSTVKYFDGLDRLVSAGYCCTSAAADRRGAAELAGRDFSCQYAYDLNGNITSLQRGGVTDLVAVRGSTVCNYGKIDNLTLSYSGNQLKSVTDLADDLTYSGAMDFRDGASGAAEYTYDANGNLTSDRNKGIVSITYNELNLPRKVSFGDGHETLYTYASDGTKLRTEYRLNNLGVLEREPLRVRSAAADVANSAVITDEAVAPYTTLTRRDYCGNYVYCNGRLERVLTPGGYISGGEQHFYITDYQGNVRVVLDSAGRPVEVNSYYPYGALTGAGQSVQPYKYGAKELDRENGLNLYDSQARHYDPILGRTTTLDPKATEYFSISPYAWCAGNPVKFVDPDGRKIVLPQGFSIENIYKVLNTLQLLTNDKLVYTIQNDGSIRIKIASLGVGKAQAGTTLIRRLNSSRKTLLIDLNNSQGYFSKDNGNRAKALDYSNAANGIGSDAIVSFDPFSDPNILTQISKDGQVSGEKRPPQIGLGHELIHAEHYMDGDLIPRNKKVSHSYINKDGKRITQVKKAEEFRTIGIFGNKKDDITENDIRKEQNLKPRGAY